MKVQWKEIKDYPNYKVNSYGEIYSKNLNKKMKLKARKDGYVRVMLYNENGGKHFYVHILVAKEFIPNILNLPEVDHMDSNRSNNRADNLMWVTRIQNLDRCFKLKRHRCNPKRIIAINLITKEEINFNSTREASRTLNVSNGHISDILHFRGHSTHNWTFKYID